MTTVKYKLSTSFTVKNGNRAKTNGLLMVTKLRSNLYNPAHTICVQSIKDGYVTFWTNLFYYTI